MDIVRRAVVLVGAGLLLGHPAAAGTSPAPADTAQVRHYLARAKALRDTNLDSARYFDRQALALAERLGFVAGQARAQLATGNGLYAAGDYPAAERHYEAALPLARHAHLCATEGHAYNGLALVAQALGNVDGALAYLQQARAAYAGCQPASVRNEIAVLTNIGNTYLLVGRTAQAERPLRQALALTTTATEPHALLNLLDLVGMLQQRQLHLDSAVVTWGRELTLARRAADRRAECFALSNLAGACLAQHRPTTALAYARRAGQLARQLGNQSQITDNTLVLAEALHALGRPEAYDTLRRYLTLQDTLMGQARTEAVAQAQARFDVAGQRTRVRVLEQERRIASLEAAQQTLRTRLAVGGSAALLVLLLGVAAWAYRRRQQRREAALRHQLAADLHDDVGTLLSQIALQTDLLQEGLGEPGQQQRHWAEVADNSRLAVRQLNDVVWSLDAENDTVPNLLDRLRDYAHEVLVPSGRDVRFVADSDLAGPSLPASARRQLYLIYKEALHNILKHAPTPATVTVTLRRHAAQLLLEVVNDGPPPAQVPPGRSSGHGLRNISERARTLGGSATTESLPTGGFAVRVQVPVG
ncbi:MAG: tetratricopeptide repeat protein [Janthinobacterium lividum]